MGIQPPELVLVEFDSGGNYLRTMTKDLRSEDITEENLLDELSKWRHEIELIPSGIAIKRFFQPDRWIGIKDLPDHYQEVLDRPQELDDERRTQFYEEIRLRLEEGDYIFYWDEDYYVNKEGEVVSS
jgi:hypothetical protein